MASHVIEVGTLKRQLPVREVKPGVFVALFNPLGGMGNTESAHSDTHTDACARALECHECVGVCV